MSAWIVTKRHIDVLVEAAVTYSREFGLTWRDGKRRKLLQGSEVQDYHIQKTIGTLDDLGAMLWLENFESVATRYPNDRDGKLPGPRGLSIADVLAYRHTPVQGLRITPVLVLKAIDCYEYQSCEHDEWEHSEANDFCDSLRKTLIYHLPGYKEAPWEIEEEPASAGGIIVYPIPADQPEYPVPVPDQSAGHTDLRRY